MVLILGNWLLPLALLVLAPAAAWAIERGALAVALSAGDGAIPFGRFLCLAVWIVFLTHGDMLG